MSTKGTSLVELLLVITAIGFLILIIANLPNSLNLISKSRHLSLAKEMASKEIEDRRALQYINLADGETNITDSRKNLLPEFTGTTSVNNCPAVVCTQSEDAKMVTVTITWQEAGKTQTVKMDTLISQGGLSQ